MLRKLVKFADHLDSKGLTAEADMVDNIIRSYAHESTKYDKMGTPGAEGYEPNPRGENGEQLGPDPKTYTSFSAYYKATPYDITWREFIKIVKEINGLDDPNKIKAATVYLVPHQLMLN